MTARFENSSSDSTSIPPGSTILISPSNRFNFLRFRELWLYRELFFFLTWRDIKVKYKQTILGIGWAILQPLFTMIVFTIFFGRLANMPSDGVDYSLFALSGLLPWIFFLNGATNASNSVVANANLIKKVYFPRIIIPFASVSSGLIDLLLAFLMVLAIMPFYDVYPSLRFLLFPVLVGFVYMTAVGVGLWLSALYALFRDIRYLITFFLQLWFFVTPIVYPTTMVPEKWVVVYGINPMVGVVEAFRWMMIGHYLTSDINVLTILISLLVSIVVFVSGIVFFRRIETSFADVV